MRIMDEKIQQYSTTKQYYTYSTLKKLGTCTVVDHFFRKRIVWKYQVGRWKDWMEGGKV